MTTLTPDETILGLLAVQACHGYELVDTFRRSSELGDVWKMSTSQIYAVLKRLERQDLITGQLIESDTAPSRTEYALTPAGKERLLSWLHDTQPSASIRRIRVEFLSRIFIARQLNISTISIVQHQRAVCETERVRLVNALKSTSPGISYLAHEFVIAQLDGVLAWIDRCELVPEDREE